ncbi:MAG TPA: YccS family putative transporter [Rhodanobacter sp.]|nr:YccS family putative transporter [Rhodanobacter sp.]
MPTLSPLALLWRRLRGSDRFAECLRVLLALGGIVAFGLLAGRGELVIPALLGAIACALAETEDHWRNRLLTVLVTLACFAIAAAAVQWLLPHPPLFAIGLPLATFALVMLGALSGRYATVAGATLILSVYTMISADLAHGPAPGWQLQTLPLLAGAAWYGALSLLWSALAPQQAVRHALARLFDALADYLDAKAALFVPIRGLDRDALQLALAMRNERVVQALNATRLVLIDRIGSRRPRGSTAALLRLYLMAQDVHERGSSSHYPYAALAEAFYHSDVLFRCEHLLRLEADSCRARARDLRLRTVSRSPGAAAAALHDVHLAVAGLHRQAQPPGEVLRRSLDALLRNLDAIHAQLSSDALAGPAGSDSELALQNPAPQSAREALARIRMQLTARSLRFRHAVRLSLALLAGYGVMQLAHPQHGYWILLTTLFVCQPSYRATRRVLLQRVAGTVAGLVAGWALLHLPLGAWQLPLIVASGVVFFAARQRRYALATAAITLFVVICVNQVGSGYAVLWPRLLDTLIGAVIAALAIYLILPDWQGRQLDHVLADTVRSEARYLARIMSQYAGGRRDDLPYRIARRDAHNADATLSGVLANMLREPDRHRQGSDLLLRFLTVAHALLGHLSTLGVHRQAIGPAAALAAVERAGAATVATLEALADSLGAHRGVLPSGDGVAAEKLAPPDVDEEDLDDETERLVLAQLALVQAQCERLVALAAQLPAAKQEQAERREE